MFSCTPVKTKMLMVVPLLLVLIALTVNGASPDEVQVKLEQARTDLRISQATEVRITADFEKVKHSGSATPEIIKDYETYISRVQAMVAENQKLVDALEAASAKHMQAGKTTGCSQPAPQGGTLSTGITVEEETGELDTLDGELNDSLAAFDEMLLQEMDDIRAQSESKMRELAEQAAAAAGSLRDQGVEVSGSSEETESDEEAEGSSADGTDKDQQQESDQAEQGGSYSKVPVTDKRDAQSRSDKDRGSGQRAEQPPESTQDDDIVARQLREAAEKETDPELKKKLWKEYEDYKRGSK
jgi:hypothetical protein